MRFKLSNEECWLLLGLLCCTGVLDWLCYLYYVALFWGVDVFTPYYYCYLIPLLPLLLIHCHFKNRYRRAHDASSSSGMHHVHTSN